MPEKPEGTTDGDRACPSSKIKLDDCDRNRTSPFDFTGNKFEFRSVGSGQSISYPLTILNAVIADGIDYVSSRLEATLKSEKDVSAAVFKTICSIMPEVKNILFDGNNYSDEWKNEAEKRGLPILKNTIAAYSWFKKNCSFLVEGKIYTQTELDAKMHVVLERYSKATLIEGSCLIDMIKTFVLPSVEEELAARGNNISARGKNTELLIKTANETL